MNEKIKQQRNLDRFGFKAKTVDRNKQWGYGYFVPSKDNKRCLWYYDGGLRTLDIDPDTICQCTGLNDSSGTPIYENDYLEIVLHGSGEIWDEAALVEYSRLGFVYTCKGEEQPLHHLEFQIAEGLVEVYVVGNKWD